MTASPWEVVEAAQQEAALCREPVRSTAGGDAAGAAEGDPEPSEPELAATIEELIREDQQEALFAQLERMGSR